VEKKLCPRTKINSPLAEIKCNQTQLKNPKALIKNQEANKKDIGNLKNKHRTQKLRRKALKRRR
jgi:hypothetical protein